MKGNKLKVMLCATPEIAFPVLQLLLKHDAIDFKGLVTMPDRPAGRGHELRSPEILECLKSINAQLPVYQVDDINQNPLLFKDLDFLLVFAFSQFLKKEVLETPRLGCFNIHTSLLPRHRGAAPIQYAIWKGDKFTGVSIQRMVKKMDAGDICISRAVSVDPDETGETLYQKLKFLSVDCLNDLIEGMVSNQLIFAKQDESKVTFAPVLPRDIGNLDFINFSAFELERQIRAFNPWPSTYFMMSGKRTKVFKSEVISSRGKSQGDIGHDHERLWIECKEGAISILELQVEGKKKTSVNEFLKGAKWN